ncbi:VOC family protein [Cyanobium sp. NIES-981]|uniref:VOC family protein n=1 Tax=Cyanobium sp. NIES-981 TaxID=1851505 RepID=UPI001CECDDBE|nr:VOC family protein [Cyanobium sp. NIES-981]
MTPDPVSSPSDPALQAPVEKTVEKTAGKPAVCGSIVLAADEPAALACFYGALLQVEPQQGLSARHWRLPWPAGGLLEFYAPSRSRPQPRQPGRLALCLQRSAAGADPVAVLEAWMVQALELGAVPLLPPVRESFGAEAWLLDPEGNRLLLLVR